jgi:molybdopterin molybdotransferase
MEKRAFTQPANPLLPPQAALDAFFARVTLAPTGIEHVSLEHAQGRVLAREIAADDDYPNASRSAMDGFAVAAARTPGAFTIAGEVRMGAPSSDSAIEGTQAIRIPTGGSLPGGADAVVPIEDAVVADGVINVGSSVSPGENVVPTGADMQRGQVVLAAGTRIGAPQTGVLAALGVTDVPVYRRPVVAVVSTGDELTPAWSVPRAGQVRDSNRYAIAASLRAMGAQVRHYPIVRDEPGECELALAAAIRECDAVAVTGGSSVGERDRIPAAVSALGAPGTIVHGLRIKPGKPALLGALGAKPILGLPGNPTSALLVLERIGAPILAALIGAPAPEATVAARLAEPVRGRPDWTWYVPVTLRHEGEAQTAHPLALHSFSVSLPARGDGYVVLDGSQEELPAGAAVTVYRFLGA